MLTITTMRNHLKDEKDLKPFCFRSGCTQGLNLEGLAEEMTDYNSSFTAADNLGMLKVLDKVVVKHLAKGYAVELPFGTLRASVSGTCRDINDGFVLGTGDNRLGILFNASESAMGRVAESLEYRQLPPDTRGEARIHKAASLNEDASESSDLSLSAGKVLRLHGRNLSFDIGDAAQGVYLRPADGSEHIRIGCYHRRGSNIVDAVVPDGLPPGEYRAGIVTRPGKSYFSTEIDVGIDVS